MSESPSESASGAASGPVSSYRERLTVPWWWWPVAAGLTGLLGAYFSVGRDWIYAVIAYAVMVPLVTAGLVLFGRAQVQVVDGELRAGRLRLPLAQIGAVRTLDPTAKRARMSRDADARAVLVTRPWITRAVELHPARAEDAPPYWLVSTRRPDVLSAVLRHVIGAPSQHGSM